MPIPFDLLFQTLGSNPALHTPGTPVYQLLKTVARAQIEPLFSNPEPTPQPFGPFGNLILPYTKMGAIDSLDLFGLDEMIIFAFYHANRGRYRRVIDIGANIGLHSIVMSRCDYEVRCFEPDPWHFSLLNRNLTANNTRSVSAFPAAISTTDGEAQFVRVLGNTTGSHLAGAKDSYGEKEHFTVKTTAIASLLPGTDLAKIDAEGHEKVLLLTFTREVMQTLDVMVEVGSPANAAAIFHHFTAMGVNLFAQKIGWQPARTAADLPTSHREGSLFLSVKPAMPW